MSGDGSGDGSGSEGLPSGWCWAKIAEVADVQLGKMLDQAKHLAGDPMPYLRNISVRWDRIDTHDLPTMLFTASEQVKYSLREGDILVCEGGEPGRSAIWTSDTDVFYQKALHRVRVRAGVEPRWLLYYLRYMSWFGLLSGYLTGTTIRHLPAEKLSAIEHALPPTGEQQRIVAKLDELLARSRAVREALTAVLPLLERYRQSVLTAAFRGELTAEWRETHPGHDASAALKIAAQERREAWLANGRSRKPGNYVSPVTADAQGNLPSSWRWTTGREVFMWGSGAFLPKNNMAGGPIPVYGGNGISGQHNEAIVAGRTVVVGRVGALCGNVHATSGPSWVTDNAIFAQWVASALNVDYARMVLAVQNLNANAGGSGQPFVSQELLDSQTLPLPPLPEQQEIVRRIDAAFTRIAAVRQLVETQLARLDALDRSILARAFRGELVPQDPSDEPASALLDRIRAERAAAPSKKTRRVRADG